MCTCSTSNALDKQVFSTSVSEVNNTFAVIVDLEYTRGEKVQLWYQFASLRAFNDKVSVSFHVYGMSGSSEMGVSGLRKMFYYSGWGLWEGDMVGWIFWFATDWFCCEGCWWEGVLFSCCVHFA